MAQCLWSSQWVFFLGEVVNFCLVWSLVWLIAYPRARQNQQLPDLKPWLALTVWERQCLEDSEQKNHSTNEWMNELINDESVHRTTPATPSLLKTLYILKILNFSYFTLLTIKCIVHTPSKHFTCTLHPLVLRYLEAKSKTLVH